MAVTSEEFPSVCRERRRGVGWCRRPEICCAQKCMEKLGDPFFGGISSHLLLNPVGNALRIGISIGLGLSLLIGIFRNEKTAMIGRTVVAVMVVGWILEIASDITPASHYGYADYADGGDAEEPRGNALEH
ncbi:hypothetical protein B0H13DRAFT_1901656 [Mycena leptocephala]|nr:hypothetical protein B0H13DRAFT_1901656 [Mycena leptocephala]